MEIQGPLPCSPLYPAWGTGALLWELTGNWTPDHNFCHTRPRATELFTVFENQQKRIKGSKSLLPRILIRHYKYFHFLICELPSPRFEYRLKRILSPCCDLPLKRELEDFSGGSVVKNPPASAGDMGSIPGPGRSHMPWSNCPHTTTTETCLLYSP